MTKFFKRLFILMPFFIFPLAFCIFVFANGRIDFFYRKLTTPRVPSIILGTSRAAQGIDPAVFNESHLQFAKPLFNFGFTNNISLYGPCYFRALKNKLRNTSGGLFILEVSPMSISDLKVNKGDNPEDFEENQYFLSKMHLFNVNPNPEYLFSYYDKPYYTLVYNNIRNNEKSPFRKFVKGFENWSSNIRDDGFMDLEVPMDSATVEERKIPRIQYFKAYMQTIKQSPLREQYFNEILSYLSSRGRIYLVRLPVDKRIYQIENKYMPEFDSKMLQLEREIKNIKYINLMSKLEEYETTDCQHLSNGSAKKASEYILEKIFEEESENGLAQIKMDSKSKRKSLYQLIRK